MDFDIFFSISQTPDSTGLIPSEKVMFSNFFSQLELADKLGFGVAWIAQAHLSTTTQKKNLKPVIPHWEGEVGLCTDFPQLALECFRRTKKIDVGSAVISILASGGPIAQAERIANTVQFLSMISKKRKLHVGFSAGRFEFMARPYGIIPRNSLEEAAWPALRGCIFAEASEIFLRLLNGEVLSSEDVRPTVLTRENFRSDEDWSTVQSAALDLHGLDSAPEEVGFPRRYEFEEIKTIPQNWRRDLLNLVIGSHDPKLQVNVNRFRPVQVFNLSITHPDVIEETHDRMAEHYHPDGGVWSRGMMPRTVMVFINDEDGLSTEEQDETAMGEAKAALSTYWSALEGTIDPEKIEKATANAVIGSVGRVADQIKERFHPDDRLMCWFDFFNHDSGRVMRNMDAFMTKVSPMVNGRV